MHLLVCVHMRVHAYLKHMYEGQRKTCRRSFLSYHVRPGDQTQVGWHLYSLNHLANPLSFKIIFLLCMHTMSTCSHPCALGRHCRHSCITHGCFLSFNSSPIILVMYELSCSKEIFSRAQMYT